MARIDPGGRSAELLARLRARRGKPLTFMEVCGTHTMAIARAGLKTVLPADIRLVSGPGCPVCVTPVGYVDHALALTRLPDTIVASFGDLMRVPGSAPGHGRASTLVHARATGGEVRVVYSPLDALELAKRNPAEQVVFLSVGFETTTPTAAAVILQAADEAVDNFSVLAANKTIPEALELLASADDLQLDGLLCPGHVSIILGTEPYRPVAERHGVACAIAGFEPVEILRGLVSLVEQVDRGRPDVHNCYAGAVRPEGNKKAREVMQRVFEPIDSAWRGLGTIPRSGLAIRAQFARHDAARRFDVDLPDPVEPAGCRCGEVLRGAVEPPQCPLFGDACTPDSPQGACMVSSEGSCAARYHYALSPNAELDG